jgi:2-polyprenyl-3-methyl-5-hydroxy-6-metoxy-1,4-benzoquinol methylase
MNILTKTYIAEILELINAKRFKFDSESFTNKQCIFFSKDETDASEVTTKDTKSQTWQKIFDIYYSKINGDPNSYTDTSVWVDSEKNCPFAPEHIDEWLELTISKIFLHLKPNSKVLEVGCGNGLILNQIIKKVESYVGIDSSIQALESIKKSNLWDTYNSKISLHNFNAIDLKNLGDEKFDFIILNSVCQYFPNLKYLLNVIELLGEIINPDSFIFFGDIRSYEMSICQYIENNDRNSTAINSFDKNKSLKRYTEKEKETLYSQILFKKISNIFPWISSSLVSLKYGVYENEMNKFRFDAMLSCKMKYKQKIKSKSKKYCWIKDKLSLTKIDLILKSISNDEIYIFENLPNPNVIKGLKTLEKYTYLDQLNNHNEIEYSLIDLNKLSLKHNLFLETLICDNPYYLNLRFAKSIHHFENHLTRESSHSIINLSNKLSEFRAVSSSDLLNISSSTQKELEFIRISDRIFDLC